MGHAAPVEYWEVPKSNALQPWYMVHYILSNDLILTEAVMVCVMTSEAADKFTNNLLIESACHFQVLFWILMVGLLNQ